MLFHYAWHEPIATPTGLENSKHGLSPDKSGNSSQCEILLATTIHGFHQGLQLPERVPPTLSNLGTSRGRACQTTAADAFAQHRVSSLNITNKNSFARSPMECDSLSENEQNCTTYVQFHMAKFCEYRITFRS